MNKLKLIKLGFCFLSLFTIIAIVVISNSLVSLDKTIDMWSRTTFSPALVRIFTIITHLGSFTMIISLIIIFLLWARKKRLSRNLQLLFMSTPLISYIINYLLKIMVQRPRPPLPHRVLASGYSFPSGHAMVSCSFYFIMAYILTKQIKKHRLILLAAFCTLILLIAFSRVALNVHYFLDIVGGLVAGVSISLLILSFES